MLQRPLKSSVCLVYENCEAAEVLLRKCQKGKMSHTKELFKGETRNKRGEMKPDKFRFGRKTTFKNLGVELGTNSQSK